VNEEPTPNDIADAVRQRLQIAGMETGHATIMSQYARNNPDQPPLFEAIPREAFRLEKTATQAEVSKPEPQKDYVPGSSEDPAHGGW
jgi:hypothetical protein